jgi:hypothetical protein
MRLKHKIVVLGGILIIVFAIGPKVRGFKPGRGQWIFKGNNIRRTPSFGGEVKPSVHVLRFTARYPTTMKRDTSRQNSVIFLANFLLLCYQVSLLVTVRAYQKC